MSALLVPRLPAELEGLIFEFALSNIGDRHPGRIALLLVSKRITAWYVENYTEFILSLRSPLLARSNLLYSWCWGRCVAYLGFGNPTGE